MISLLPSVGDSWQGSVYVPFRKGFLRMFSPEVPNAAYIYIICPPSPPSSLNSLLVGLEFYLDRGPAQYLDLSVQY